MTHKRNPAGGRMNTMLGATVAGSIALGSMGVQADSNPFQVAELGSGYMVAENQAEGQCGGMATGEEKANEGNCAGMEGMSDSGEAAEDKAAEKKGGEGKCGEGKCANS